MSSLSQRIVPVGKQRGYHTAPLLSSSQVTLYSANVIASWLDDLTFIRCLVKPAESAPYVDKADNITRGSRRLLFSSGTRRANTPPWSWTHDALCSSAGRHSTSRAYKHCPASSQEECSAEYFTTDCHQLFGLTRTDRYYPLIQQAPFKLNHDLGTCARQSDRA